VTEQHPTVDRDERRLSRNGRRRENGELDPARLYGLPINPWRPRERSSVLEESCVAGQSLARWKATRFTRISRKQAETTSMKNGVRRPRVTNPGKKAVCIRGFQSDPCEMSRRESELPTFQARSVLHPIEHI
jgi:hypothetical protein